MPGFRVERSGRRSHPVGLRLAILFMGMSAAVGLFVSIVNLKKPFPVPGHLMGEPDFATPHGLVNYVSGLVFILLFNVPLLYGGMAGVFNLGSAATSIILAFASASFGIAGWGLYRFRNWARLLTLTISVITVLAPMLGVFPPFFVDSYAAMTAFLPFVAPCVLMVFYLKREDVRQLFASASIPSSV